MRTVVAWWWTALADRVRRTRRRDEGGYVAIVSAIVVVAVALPSAAVAVDVGSWYVQAEKVQKAADAAALGGVPFLPQDLASAQARALEVAARNGFDNATGNTVSVTTDDKATQLKVTISATVTNSFGSMIGLPQQVITRSATADYQGPAPMGSPCNTFGNEPNPGNRGVVQPVGSANGTTSCPRQPEYWATVEGPQTDKIYGDRYQTKGCTAGVDLCTNRVNTEYDDFGYVFVVRVAPGAVGTQVDLQLYDPGFVYTNLRCESLPASTSFPVNSTANRTKAVNPYVTNEDAVNRYSKDGAYGGLYTGDKASNYCTGDFVPSTPVAAMTTSFALRQQTDTQNPKITPVQNGTNGKPCLRQYGSWSGSGNAVSLDNLTSTSTSYMGDQVAAQFHNWVSFCTFVPPRAGDYYLQVRTNVKMKDTSTSAPFVQDGNTDVLANSGNLTTGNGVNSFAMRAVTSADKVSSVAVSGYNHMPIYVNSTSATPNFYLLRVLPGAAGQKISFSYFDIGDAQSSGNVTVQVPPDAKGTITSTPFPGGCTAYGGSAGGSQTSQTTLTGCSAPFVKASSGSDSRNNGKTETMTIPIPSDYTCDYTVPTGCWYRVKVSFGTGTVNDITTWDATVVGDPVRLVK